jgi:FKBP-type peptidyl-prolyl cis-trans isomerase SlyD
MKISSPCVAALTWTLKDSLGEILDELTDPVEFMVGGEDLLAKIEQSMLGLGAGDKLKLHLEPEDAFGLFNETLVFLESRALFPPELEVGMTIEGHALPVGCNPDAPSDIFYTVTDLYPDHVVLDGNHPLAGFFKIVPQAPGGASLH